MTLWRPSLFGAWPITGTVPGTRKCGLVAPARFKGYLKLPKPVSMSSVSGFVIRTYKPVPITLNPKP